MVPLPLPQRVNDEFPRYVSEHSGEKSAGNLLSPTNYQGYTPSVEERAQDYED